MITATIVGLYVADKIIGSYLSKGFSNYVSGPIQDLIQSEDDLKSRLAKVINTTCDLLEKEYGSVETKDNSFPFYHSADVLIELVKYRQFKEFDREKVENIFINHPNIINPSKEQLEFFYKNFEKQVRSDETLKLLEIDETYKEKIFEIHSVLSSLEKSLVAKMDMALIRGSDSLLNEYKEGIKEFHKSLYDFKPRTALNLVEGLEKRVNQGDKENGLIIAKINELKGLSYKELSQQDGKSLAFIKAYKYDKSNIEYKLLAGVSYCELDEVEKGINLIDEVLEIDEFNPVAWITKIEFNDSFKKLPITVTKSQKFKCHFANYVFRKHKVKHLDYAFDLFSEDLLDGKYPEEITYQNKLFWITILNLRFNRFSRVNIFNYTFKPPFELKSNIDLQFSFKILEKLHLTFKNSEIPEIEGLYYNYLYTGYLLNPTKNKAKDLFEEFKKSEKKEERSIQVIFSLTQTEQFNEALELIKSETNRDSLMAQLGSQICIQLKKLDEAKAYSNEYFKKIDRIDKFSLEHAAMHIEILCPNEEESNLFIESIKENKLEINEESLGILTAFALSRNPGKKEDVLLKLKDALPYIKEDDDQSRRLISNTYSMVKEYEKANEIIEPFLDKSRLSPELYFFIENLYYSKKRNDYLLELLSQLRKFKVSKKHLYWEIEVAKDLPDWNRIKEVTEIGIHHFSNEIDFQVYRVIALQQLSNSKELLKALNLLDRVEISQDNAIRLANICKLNNEYSLAFRFIYPFAKEKENVDVREFYAFSLGLYLPEDFFKKFETINENCAVTIETEGKIEALYINQTSIRNNSLIKNLIGKRIGEEYSYASRIPGKTIKSRVISILPKEQQLIRDIYKDIRDRPNAGYNAFTVQWEGDAKGMLDKMSELFGAQEIVRNKRIKVELENYNEGRLSFSEIVNSAFNGKPINAYSYFTSNLGNTFRVIPSYFCRNAALSSKTQFVLDFSTIPLFYELDLNHKIKFSNRFIISQFVLDFLREWIYEASNEKGSQASIMFSETGAFPRFVPKDFKENNVKYLQGLFDWCKENCDTKLVKEKLDVLINLRAENPDIDPYFDYMLDTSFLSTYEDHVLVSDDMVFVKLNLLKTGKLISSEIYLKNGFKESYTSNILPILLGDNYLGLSLTSEMLYSEYSKIVGGNDPFIKCLRNISFDVSCNPKQFADTIEFVKMIYLSEGTLAYKRSTSSIVFSYLLKGVNINERNFKLMESSISLKFNLLGEYRELVLEDFKNNIK